MNDPKYEKLIDRLTRAYSMYFGSLRIYLGTSNEVRQAWEEVKEAIRAVRDYGYAFGMEDESKV